MDDNNQNDDDDDNSMDNDMNSSFEDHGIRVLCHSKSGSIATVHEVGATILSFHPSPDKEYCEILFMSRDAVLNGTKAIRGGIPLVFPVFGPPGDDDHSDMPQHGFARTNVWKVDRTTMVDDDNQATVEYCLAVDAADDLILSRGTKGLWAPSATTSPSCFLRYKITLTASSLTTTLTMTNTTTSIAFPVQALFHTYYQVHCKAAMDPTKTYVKGLLGYDIIDKVDPSKSTKSQTDDTITLFEETDRIYTPPQDDTTHTNPVTVTIGVAHPTHGDLTCTAHGTVDGAFVPISWVVWNPHQAKAKAMADFGDDQYEEMICVEPGILGKPILEPGKEAVLEQTIQVAGTTTVC